MPRILVVHGGADFSTADVGSGIVRALIDQGVQVGAYGLADRIATATGWVNYMYKRARRNDPDLPKPTEDETMNRIFNEASKDVLPMALDNGVDGVLIISGMFVPGQTLFRLKQARIPTGLLITEAPYDDARHIQIAPLVDVVWVNERTSVARLRAVQPQTYYLPAAYDPVVHTAEPQPGDEDVPAHDVVFVGTAFQERVDLLAAVDWAGMGIDLGLYGNWSEYVGGRSRKARKALEPYIRGGMVRNRYAAALYRRAKIGLNLYRTSVDFRGKEHIDKAESLNPRAYELAACGCLQFSYPEREEETDVFHSAPWDHVDRDDQGRVVGGVYGIRMPGMCGCISAGEFSWRLQQYFKPDPWGGPAWEAMRQQSLTNIQPHTFAARARQLMEQFEPVLDRQYAVAYG